MTPDSYHQLTQEFRQTLPITQQDVKLNDINNSL